MKKRYIFKIFIQLILLVGLVTLVSALLTKQIVDQEETIVIAGYAVVFIVVIFILVNDFIRSIRKTSKVSKLKTRSERDALTGLFNRAYTFDVINSYVSDGGRVQQFSVAFIDVNGLKEINDNTGHNAGDELLKKVSYVLKSENRANHLLARIGGDEFLVVAKNTKTENLNKFFTRVLDTFAEINASAKYDFNFSISYGIKDSAEHLEEFSHQYKSFDKFMFVESIVQAADDLMYENKKLVKSVSPSVIKSSVYLEKYKELLSKFNRYGNLEDLIKEINTKFDQHTVKYYISNIGGKVVYPRNLDDFTVPDDVLVHVDTMSEVSVEDRFSHKLKKEYTVIDKRVMFDSKNYAFVTVVLEKSYASDVDFLLSELEDRNVFEEMYFFEDKSNYENVVHNALAKIGEAFETDKVFVYKFDEIHEYANLIAKFDPKNIIPDYEAIEVTQLNNICNHIRALNIVKVDSLNSVNENDQYLRNKLKKSKLKRAMFFPWIEKSEVIGFVALYNVSAEKSSVKQEIKKLAGLISVFCKAFNYSQRIMNLYFSEEINKGIVASSDEAIMVLVDGKVQTTNDAFVKLFDLTTFFADDVFARIAKVTKSNKFEKQYQDIEKNISSSFNFKKSKIGFKKTNYTFSIELQKSNSILSRAVVCKVKKK